MIRTGPSSIFVFLNLAYSSVSQGLPVCFRLAGGDCLALRGSSTNGCLEMRVVGLFCFSCIMKCARVEFDKFVYHENTTRTRY